MSNLFGYDISNPGASPFSRGSVDVAAPYYVAVVEDIIINEEPGKYLTYNKDGSNIGVAKIRFNPQDALKELKDLPEAYPLDTNIQEYPFVGELVLVFPTSTGDYYYSRKLNIKRKITENRAVVSQRQISPADRNVIADTRDLSALGVPESTTRTLNSETNSTPKLNFDTRPIRSAPGDLIFQSRFGGAIRMGSSLIADPTVAIPEPNVKITAGFWKTPEQLSTGNNITDYSLAYEDINNDRSSIWMVSNQEVKLEAAPAINKSPIMVTPGSYLGAQIFINSDRVVLNSKTNEISLFSKKEINLVALGTININTENNISLRTLSNAKMVADKSILIQAPEISIMAGNLTQKVTGDYGISGKRIFIGKYGDVTQPMVLGRQLASFLTTLTTNIALLNAAVTGISAVMKTLPSGVGPVATPLLAANVDTVLVNISTQLAALISGTNPLGAIFYSQDNFVSKVNT